MVKPPQQSPEERAANFKRELQAAETLVDDYHGIQDGPKIAIKAMLWAVDQRLVLQGLRGLSTGLGSVMEVAKSIHKARLAEEKLAEEIAAESYGSYSRS